MIYQHESNMLSRRTAIATAVLGAVVPLGGCGELLGSESGPPPVEALDASIVDVRPPDTGLTSATIPVVLEMVNTHQSDQIPSPTVDYDAFVNDAEVASARKDVTSLGPGDTANEEFELIAEYADIGSGIVSAIRDGSFRVRIEGSVESEGSSTAFTSRYEL